MFTKNRKTKGVTKTAEEILGEWVSSQEDNYEMSLLAKESWESGNESTIDISEVFDGVEVVTHCEKFYVGKKFIVVCWDDNGNVTYGGM